MNPIKTVKRYFREQVRKEVRAEAKKAFDPMENIDLDNVVGWRKVGGSVAFGYYQDHQYENGYSSIRVLAEAFAMIEQYTIDKTGKSVSSNLLDRLYTPNTDMSAYDFREALMVTTLVHDKVRLRVHHSGSRINMESLEGFTFMEGYTEDIVDGKRHYKMPNGDTYTDDEVITLKSVNPDNITGGFSPSRAARRWTRLDDYIADYQKGFFENHAIPAGEMIITARTVGEYNDIVDMMQAKHKGAGKNDNITYVHRPTDQSGKPLNAQVEWVPFSSQNKDMALKDLFENVNKKIDSVYGVPQELRGFLSNSNYASVSVAEKVLVKYGLNPKALKIWSKFTHELNRITGGMGVAISYDLDIPVVAEEDKVKAESKQIDAATVSTLTTEGYTLDSAIEYVKKGDIELLKLGEPPKPDKPEVTTPEEIKNTPDQPLDIYSKALGKLIKKMPLPVIEGLNRCACCKGLGEHYDTGFECYRCDASGSVNSKEALQPIPCDGAYADGGESHQSKKAQPKTKQLSEIDKELYEFQFKRIVREQMTRQVDKAIVKLDEAMASKAFGDTTEEEDKVFTAALLALMVPLMVLYGNRTVNTGMNLIVSAGLSTEGITRFEFTPAQMKAYERYLAKIGTGYADQTAEQIRQVLGQGILDGSTKAEIEANLRQVILGPENEYRVARLARTEVNLSEGRASVSAMENISDQTGIKVYKKWNTSGLNPCPFCTELAGKEVLVETAFVPLGDSVKAGDQVFHNNWIDVESAELHANCNCYTTYRVERG